MTTSPDGVGSFAHSIDSVRDMFELFRAVVPVHNRKHMQLVPRFGALYHNDCLFLSNHLLGLPIRYPSK